MDYNLERSDDEMDLLGPLHRLDDTAASGDPVTQGERSPEETEEEILTSDPEELAEILANKSLEKYRSGFDDTSLERGINSKLGREGGDLTASPTQDSITPQISMERNSFRSHPMSPSSSPTHMTQASEDNFTSTDENAMSEDVPQSSSPNDTFSRYSPPAHFQGRPAESIEDPGSSSGVRQIPLEGKNFFGNSQPPLGVPAPGYQDAASEVGPAMSLVNSPNVGPSDSPSEVAELLQMSAPGATTLPLQTLPSSPSPSVLMEDRTGHARLVSSSPKTNPPKVTASQTISNSQSLSHSPSLPTAVPPDPAPLSSGPTPEAPHGRALRARTARQQHPYALEYAVYKNAMRRAGLDDAIVRLQVLEQEKSRKHPNEVQPDMNDFIVPEDEESQDIYVPPATPPPRTRRSESTGPVAPSIDMEALLAGFGGMISDDESPARRRARKGKDKEKNPPAKVHPAPKPFPLNTTKKIHPHASTSKSSLGPGPSSIIPQIAPSPSPESHPPTKHRRQVSSLSNHHNRKSPAKKSNQPEPGSSSSSSSSSPESESESESESKSDASSSGSLVTAAERKRFRILRRMMPAAWVRRQMAEERRKQEAKTANRIRPEVSLRPGQARIKTRIQGSDAPLVLRGDSESDDDVPQPAQQNQLPNSSPPTQKSTRSRVFPSKRLIQSSDESSSNDVIDLLSGDDRSSIIEMTTPGVDDEEISSWLERKVPTRTTKGRTGGGGDLINRMLSRTNGSAHDTRQKSRKVRAGYDRDGNKLKQAKLTSMFRASSPRHGVLDISSSDGEDRARASNRSSKSKKNAQARARAGGSSVAGATRNSRPGRALTIQGDLAELLDATTLPRLERNSGKNKAAAHNRAISAGVHIREGPKLSQGQPSVTLRPAKVENFGHRTVSTDSGIVPFQPHIKFLSSSYLGRGYLQNLINVVTSADISPVEATPAIVFGEHLDIRLTGTEFVGQVQRLIPHWADWLAGRQNENDTNVFRSFRFVALRVTFLFESVDDELSEGSLEIESESRAFMEEDATEIYKIVTTLALTDPAMRDDSSPSTTSWLSFHWFVVELAFRIACGNRKRALRLSETASLASTNLDASIQRAIRLLLGHNLPDNVREAYESNNDIDDPVLEIWVCLLYLVDETEPAGIAGWKPLWNRVEAELGSPEFALPYKVYESERRWEYIFSFAVLEAFSPQTGRLLPSRLPISRWPWVCRTIKDIRLKEDKVVEEAKQRRQRIDYYVRTVTARCWLMHTMWGWDYARSDRLLNLLYPVFQTRKLAKLRDERTDFPTFVRNLDLEHLERFSKGDTAWSIFLKIFRRSIIDNPASARKLYSAYAPVAVLNFTNENPATDMDLSRLFNSFSMFIVTLITDPNSERGADCVRRIQSLMPFKTADMRSREACIRAFQYLGLLFKHFDLDMTPLVSWLQFILQSLQDDIRGATIQTQRNRLVLLVLCLVRGVAAITSTSGFDQNSKKTYPETSLLTEDFSRTLFLPDLKNNVAARREIKQFLEAFCHTRDAFLATLPAKPVPEATVEEESQESYGFEDFDLDLDNPEVLAGLDAFDGDLPDTVHPDPLVLKERRTAEIFNKVISPSVFENMILGFGLDDRRLSHSPERGYDVAEESAWIRVWFGCVKIVVENHRRSWLDYLNDWGGAKDERISRIIDVGAERRVRIYFCYLALKHAPSLVQRGSKEQKHQFLLPWFQCLPHHRYTIEHKYTALICQLGLKNNPLLEGLPCKMNDRGEYYVLSSELVAERGNYIRCIFQNLLRVSQAHHEDSSAAEFTRARTCVAKLLETMRQCWELLGRPYAPPADRELIPSYLEFCRGVRCSAAEFLTTPSIQDLFSRLSWVPLA